MGRRNLATVEYTCDNFTNGNTARELAHKRCFVKVRFEYAMGIDSPEHIIREKYHWRQNARGWNCPNGHFHRYPGSITKEEIVHALAEAIPDHR